LWVPPASLECEDVGHDEGADNADVAEARALLARYGYGVSTSGPLDQELAFVLRAFQLHFRPGRVDSRLDRSTLLTLRRLVDALPAPAIV